MGQEAQSPRPGRDSVTDRVAPQPRGLILGGGMTGLAAGIASGLPVYEAGESPGGICRSYAVSGPAGEYAFEVGGGHWIFGGSPRVNALLEGFTPLLHYRRRAAVLLAPESRLVPYPIQNHLGALPAGLCARILGEIRAASESAQGRSGRTEAGDLDSWLRNRFGPTLHACFFGPFHARYTAGLASVVAVEDREKTPLDRDAIERGARSQAAGPVFDGEAGYNARFVYPECGLAELARRMGGKCDLHHGRRAVEIDLRRRRVAFEDGTRAGFERLVSTLPLHQTLALCGLDAGEPDPHTGVRVLNVGARRGSRCPDAHWVYVSHSRSGFHRVGFYSNVDERFLPEARRGGAWVSLYVERALRPGAPADPAAEAREDREALEELRGWGFIGEAEVVHSSRIDVAYTWVRPRSRWRERAVSALADAGIVTAGRYGSWRFQGIARSLEEGLDRGAELRAALES